jgi:hypothetical protein
MPPYAVIACASCLCLQFMSACACCPCFMRVSAFCCCAGAMMVGDTLFRSADGASHCPICKGKVSPGWAMAVCGVGYDIANYLRACMRVAMALPHPSCRLAPHCLATVFRRGFGTRALLTSISCLMCVAVTHCGMCCCRATCHVKTAEALATGRAGCRGQTSARTPSE